MRLYEILTPVANEDGLEYHHTKMSDFLQFVGKEAGGYSVLPHLEGSWRDPVDGKTYIDTMVPVRVGCNTAQWSDIVAHACITWPDQAAFMHYVVGDNVTFTRTDGSHG